LYTIAEIEAHLKKMVHLYPLQSQHWIDHGVQHLNMPSKIHFDPKSVASIEDHFGVVLIVNSSRDDNEIFEYMSRLCTDNGYDINSLYASNVVFNKDTVTKWVAEGHGIYVSRKEYERKHAGKKFPWYEKAAVSEQRYCGLPNGHYEGDRREAHNSTGCMHNPNGGGCGKCPHWKTEGENNMAINEGKPGDYLKITEKKNPLCGKIIRVVEVLKASKKLKGGAEPGDAYRVYKCDVEGGGQCMVSPTEVERAEGPNSQITGLWPLGKVRLAPSAFRRQAARLANESEPSGDSWEILSITVDKEGRLSGIKVGCTAIDIDGLRDILDRVAEMGYPLSAADSMEKMPIDTAKEY